ncbi:hypothetical protein [Bordetella sp. FB-8]|uniref:hypothetical protein n=1 Tax=Bordetella sp. FB-8 TaxID=1159870 RepID=UPI00036501F1|nr:hypothetical protein [Bordetella sp. FB-8]
MNFLREEQYKNLLLQMRDPDRRSWILLNPTSIGDTTIVCAFAQAFVEQHGHEITLVIPPDHVAVAQMYANRFLRVHTAERNLMMQIANNFLDPTRFEIDVPICAHPYDLGDCRMDNLMYLYKYPGRGGMTLTDIFRHLLRLPWEAKLERPNVPAEWDAEAEQIAQKIGMPKGESVILFPANSSEHPQFPDIFWETVAARLTRRGFKVFCNMRGGNFRPKIMPIIGTTPIEVYMHQALSLVNYAGRTICSVNGMQFLQLLGGRFAQMSVAMPLTKTGANHHQNGRQYHSTGFMNQYMCPELLCDVTFSEFSVPFDGTDQELSEVAMAIADDNFDHPNCMKRMGESGQIYIEEQNSWLRKLVTPLSRAIN